MQNFVNTRTNAVNVGLTNSVVVAAYTICAT